MKICLKNLFIFIIILSFLTISVVDASDMDIDDSMKSYDDCLNIAEIDGMDGQIGDGVEDSDTSEDNSNANDDTNPEDNTNNDDTNQEDNTNNDETTSLNNKTNQSKPIVKTTPKITVKTTKLKSRDTLVIYLKNSNKTPLKSKKITVIINNKNVTTHTNSKGIANINIFLIPKKYKIAIKFAGDKYLNPCTKKLNLTVSKLSTKIKTNANYVVKKNRFYFYLIGNDWKGVPKTKVIIKFRGKTYIKMDG